MFREVSVYVFEGRVSIQYFKFCRVVAIYQRATCTSLAVTIKDMSTVRDVTTTVYFHYVRFGLYT